MSVNERLSRRDFARLLALSGSAALFPLNAFAQPGTDGILLADLGLTDAPLPRTPADPDEKFWREVRSRFLLPLPNAPKAVWKWCSRKCVLGSVP